MKNSIFIPEKRLHVRWKDLVELSTREKVVNLLISLPWLGASWFFAYLNWWPLAVVCSFVFFLTGLRQAHDAFHASMGISKTGHHLVMFFLSLIMLCSMHAVKHNHLQHHKHCLDDEDMEGYSARLSWWKAILYGPIFIFLHHYHALKNGSPLTRKWVWLEIACMLAVVILALVWAHPIALYHMGIMVLGEFFTAFFAVWTVHHDCEPDRVFSRTLRGKYLPAIFYNMFYHTEHHLYPKVPTSHLPELAKRIDLVFPEVISKQIFHSQSPESHEKRMRTT